MAGRKIKVNIHAVEEFIQPQLEEIIRDVGLKYGFILPESKKLFLTYYKEYILKNLHDGDFSHLRISGFGHILPSRKKISNFQNSKYNTDEYKETVEKIVENSKLFKGYDKESL